MVPCEVTSLSFRSPEAATEQEINNINQCNFCPFPFVPGKLLKSVEKVKGHRNLSEGTRVRVERRGTM